MFTNVYDISTTSSLSMLWRRFLWHMLKFTSTTAEIWSQQSGASVSKLLFNEHYGNISSYVTSVKSPLYFWFWLFVSLKNKKKLWWRNESITTKKPLQKKFQNNDLFFGIDKYPYGRSNKSNAMRFASPIVIQFVFFFLFSSIIFFISFLQNKNQLFTHKNCIRFKKKFSWLFFLLHRSRLYFTPVLYNYSLRCMLMALYFEFFFVWHYISKFRDIKFGEQNSKIPWQNINSRSRFVTKKKQKQTKNYNSKKIDDSIYSNIRRFFWIKIYIFFK